MRPARVVLAGAEPFEARCELRAGWLHCEVQVTPRPVQFEWMSDGSVRIVKGTVNRSWPADRVRAVDWLER